MVTEMVDKFNIKVTGQGEKIMMFAHGLGCDQTMWRFITPAFENEYTIIVFDFLGSGGSDLTLYDPKNYPTLNEYADDVIEILTSLNKSNVVYIGHSVGCMIGMLAAIKSPHHFQHVIMVAPSPCYINDRNYTGGFDKVDIDQLLQKLKDNLIGWSENYAPMIMGNKDRPALAGELQESFLSSNHNALYHFAELTFRSDLRQLVEKMNVPTLVMQCNEDVIAPIEVGKYMHEHLPKNDFVVMNASGHCAHLSEPKETVGLIENYLKLKDGM